MTIRSTRRVPALMIGVASLGLLLAACGGGSSGGTSGASTPAASPPAASGGGGGGGKTVTATETEFKIALSTSSVKPGTYTLNAVNSGTITHALEINGPGVSDKATGDISPTKSATLTVTLSKGSYEIWCPVANHKAMGMDTHLTVS
jgi:plastocyanin